MIALGLLVVAFQVQVNVDVNSQGGSGSVAVRPSRVRIAVTEEHRRTAFKDATARDLLLRARAARLLQDSTLRSYDAKSYQRISVGMAIRETARDRLVYRMESASRVQWHRNAGAYVTALGARQAVPIVQGIPEASKEMQDELESELGDMFNVPYYPGKDQLWLLEQMGSSDSTGTILQHPLAEGSEAYFTFETGDSMSVELPDGTRIALRELIIRPRQAAWNLVVGSFWFETERASLVRAVMRFSERMDVWEVAKQDDPTAQDDVPLFVRPLVSPMRAEMTAVTIEYGLFNQRFWLPRVQGAEGYARVSFMRIPIKVEQRYRYESVNMIDSLPPIPFRPVIRGDSLRDSLKKAGLDSAAVSKEVRRIYAERDTAARDERKKQCETGETYWLYERRNNGQLPMAIEVPCDRTKLETSPELPPSIYDPGEELFGAKEREELMQALDFALQPEWGAKRPVLDWGLHHTRYNRVEGFATGATASMALGRGYTASLNGRVSLADMQLNGEFAMVRSNGRRELRAAVYRRLMSSGDFGAPLTFGPSLGAMLYARDEGFYHRAWGGELTSARVQANGFAWRLFAEQQWEAPVESRWSLFGGAHDDRFLGNVTADKAWYYGAGLNWRGSRGLDPAGWRVSADVRLEAASGQYIAPEEWHWYGRGFLETTVSRGFGPLAASLTGAVGGTHGDLPSQRHFFLGGLQSLRGQTAGTGYGRTFWLTRFEIGSNNAAFRPVVFGDLGWAGNERHLGNIGRPMSGAGVGMSFLDGLFRVDLARGIHPRAQTRFDISVEARF